MDESIIDFEMQCDDCYARFNHTETGTHATGADSCPKCGSYDLEEVCLECDAPTPECNCES